jgi:hypothetical protein
MGGCGTGQVGGDVLFDTSQDVLWSDLVRNILLFVLKYQMEKVAEIEDSLISKLHGLLLESVIFRKKFLLVVFLEVSAGLSAGYGLLGTGLGEKSVTLFLVDC